MKRLPRAAFTLVELLMVMLIISIVASLIAALAKLANQKSTYSKALAEIAGLSSACDNYKTDNGTYPRLEKVTEQAAPGATAPIDPRHDGDPSQQNYKDASLFLYEQLSGDLQATGKPPPGAKTYYPFKNSMLAVMTGGSGGSGQVLYLQDPFGLSYGYSTAGNRAEEDFRAQALSKSSATRTTPSEGFNSTFDLWSTVGLTTSGPTDQTRASWAKNW